MVNEVEVCIQDSHQNRVLLYVSFVCQKRGAVNPLSTPMTMKNRAILCAALPVIEFKTKGGSCGIQDIVARRLRACSQRATLKLYQHLDNVVSLSVNYHDPTGR